MSEPTSSASEGRNASTEKVATSEGHHVVTTVTGNDASAPSPDIPNQSGDSSDEEDKFDGPSKEEEEEDEADRQKRMAMAKARGGRRRVSVSAEVMSAGSVTQYTPKVVPKTEEQMAAIKAAIADNFLFHADNMSAANLKTVLDSMEKIEAKEGEDTIAQGDLLADYFYVVESGEFDVYVEGKGDDKPVFHYGPGGSFGELALMYNAARAATVRCCSAGGAVMWGVDRATFRHIIVSNTNEIRKTHESHLLKMAIFEGMSESDVAKVADALFQSERSAGETIITQGDADNALMKFYLIEEGECIAQIKDEKSGEQVTVGELKAGDYFGEKALISGEPRAATIVATTDVKLAAMDVAAFERVMGSRRASMERRMSEYKSVDDAKSAAE